MKYVPEERYSQQKKGRWGALGWRRDVSEFTNPTEILHVQVTAYMPRLGAVGAGKHLSSIC